MQHSLTLFGHVSTDEIIMRDDLHKKAPVPRRVQKLFKLALREADRLNPDRLRTAAQDALECALREGISNSMLDHIAGRAEQGELFRLIGRDIQACSPIESDIIANLAERAVCSKIEALSAGLEAFTSSWPREIKATMIAEGAPDTSLVMTALSVAFDGARSSVAQGVCDGATVVRRLPAVTLEENLLPQGMRRA
jgi:hypothetical protein